MEELKNYIEGERAKGVSDDVIRNDLVSQGGWTDSDLDSLFDETVSADHTDEQFANVQAENKKTNPILLGVLIFLILIVGGTFVFFLFSKDETVPLDVVEVEVVDKVEIEENLDIADSNTIVSDFGFTLDLPDGWRLWIGASAIRDAGYSSMFADTENMNFKPGSNDYRALQNYVNDWTPKNSQVLVFTTIDLETSSRDLVYVYEMLLKSNEDEFLGMTASLTVVDEPIAYAEAGDYSNRKVSQHDLVNFDGDIQEIEGFLSEGEYNLSFTEIPLKNNSHILFLLRSAVKKDGEGDFEPKEFIQELSLTNI